MGPGQQHVRGRFTSVPLTERFWEKVDRNGPVHPVLGTACWLWTGAPRLKDGRYGCVRVGGRNRLAHHVAWELHHGRPLPKRRGWHGTVVRHTCNNNKCVNPAHLLDGTHRQNMIDAGRDGLLGKADVRGTKNPMARWSDAQVAEAKRLRSEGWIYLRIAEQLGIPRTTINLWCTGYRRSA